MLFLLLLQLCSWTERTAFIDFFSTKIIVTDQHTTANSQNSDSELLMSFGVFVSPWPTLPAPPKGVHVLSMWEESKTENKTNKLHQAIHTHTTPGIRSSRAHHIRTWCVQQLMSNRILSHIITTAWKRKPSWSDRITWMNKMDYFSFLVIYFVIEVFLKIVSWTRHHVLHRLVSGVSPHNPTAWAY